MRFGLGVAIAGGILLGACSNGGDAGPPDSLPPSTPPVDTTDPTSDTSPPTSAPNETTPTTPPTTDDPTEALIAEIEADLNEGEQALLAAIAAPDDPASEELVRRYFSGAALELVLEGLDSLRSEGLVGRPSDDVPSVIKVRSLETSDDERAVVVVCRVDAAVIIDPLPSGEAIVNDRVTTVVSRSEVVRRDGVWVFDDGTQIEAIPGATSCD